MPADERSHAISAPDTASPPSKGTATPEWTKPDGGWMVVRWKAGRPRSAERPAHRRFGPPGPAAGRPDRAASAPCHVGIGPWGGRPGRRGEPFAREGNARMTTTQTPPVPEPAAAGRERW